MIITYVTTMPDHVGAFLKASECFAALHMNITRVSYNKAVDINLLFIDADGSETQHKAAKELLMHYGYLQNPKEKKVVLLEFDIQDEPGRLVTVLKLIERYEFNISYISSQENGEPVQHFRMGLFVEDDEKIKSFLQEAQKLCPVRAINYDRSERTFDNSIFYSSFAGELQHIMDLSEEDLQSLIINTNLAMQILDGQGLLPHTTFDSIRKFATLLANGRGENFQPRITDIPLTGQTFLTLIEPPCGSNTAILRSGQETLVIDCGYACYRQEMLPILEQYIPEWNTQKKRILISHADVDHCGLLNDFDEVLCNERSAECLRLEAENKDGFREQNPLHKPYIRICKTLTSYRPVDTAKLNVLWKSPAKCLSELTRIGTLNFGDMNFTVYEGKGGHLPGEIVLIDFTNHVAFTGDVFVNTHDMTKEQALYNSYAPILMTSVDTDPALCKKEREAFYRMIRSGQWMIFGAHGFKKDYSADSI